MKVAIYALLDKNHDTRYIGKANDPLLRLRVHLRIKPWVANYEILEWVEISEWKHREIYWIWKYRSEGYPLVNMTRGGDGVVGATPEVRAKISKALKGRKLSPEFRARLSAIQKANGAGKWMLGKKVPHISNGHKGMKHSEETKRKIGLGNSGKVRSAETRRNISVGAKTEQAANTRTRSAEARRKTSLTLMGHSVSKETRAKLRALAIRQHARGRTQPCLPL